MGIKEDMATALKGGAAPVEPADDKPATDPAATNVTGDETPGAEGTGDEKVDPEKKEPEKEPDPIPYLRWKEKVDEANLSKEELRILREENKKLMGDLSELAKAITSGQTVTKSEKIEAKKDIAGLVRDGKLTQEDANKFTELLDAANVDRGASRQVEETLKQQLSTQGKEIETLKKVIFGDKDSQERKEALKDFDGIVTEDSLKAKIQEMVNSRDPSRVHMANNASYKQIIKSEFTDEIIKYEVNKTLESKKPNAPKIAVEGKGKTSTVRKPDGKEVVFDPKSPRSSDVALKNLIRSNMQSAE